MIGSDVEGFQNLKLLNNSMLKEQVWEIIPFEISVMRKRLVTKPLDVNAEDIGEDVSYTIQLIVLDYTIIPFVDIENI